MKETSQRAGLNLSPLVMGLSVCYVCNAFLPSQDLMMFVVNLIVFSVYFRVHKIPGTILHAAYNKKKEDRHNLWACSICHHQERDDSNSESYCAIRYELF